MNTTLNKLKEAGACQKRYAHLLRALGKTEADDEPLAIAKIIETNGIQDAVWALQTVKGYGRELRHFAADCAEIVLPIYEKEYPNDDRPRKAIQAARDFADGKIDAAAWAEAWAAASDAAWAAATAATSSAATAAAWAAATAAAWAAASGAAWAAASGAASDAAWAAATAATWDDIKNLLIKYIEP